MISGWVKRDDYWTNISSPGFERDQKYRGYLETRKLGSSDLRGLKKKQHAVAAAPCIAVITTRQNDRYGICPVELRGFTWKWKFDASSAKGVGK